MDEKRRKGSIVGAAGSMDNPKNAPPEAGSEPLRTAGRYRLGKRLGHGTFGEVFAAHDPLLDRPVALKILEPGLEPRRRRRALDRFRVELRVFGRVTHPHVVQVFDACLTGETPYLVMELCSGPTLATWRARYRNVPPGQAAVIFHQAALAVDHIHQLGIVHRDIKPSNLLFHHKFLKLTDFGIAQADFIPQEDSTQIEGTPGYMAPEQVTGDPVTHRADLFSLAAVLYELLTGRIPFPGDPSSITYVQVFDKVPAISAAFPDLPPDFDEFFATALARNPADRFASASEMVAALSEIIPAHALEAVAGTAGPGLQLAPPPPTGFRYGQVSSPVAGRFPHVPPREPPPFPTGKPPPSGGIPAPWAEGEATSPFGADIVAFEQGSPKTELLREAFAAAPRSARDGESTVRIDRDADDDITTFPAAEEGFNLPLELAVSPHPSSRQDAGPAVIHDPDKVTNESSYFLRAGLMGLVSVLLVVSGAASWALISGSRIAAGEGEEHRVPTVADASETRGYGETGGSTGKTQDVQATFSKTSPGAPLILKLRIHRGLDGLRFDGTAHTNDETWRIVRYAREGVGRYAVVLEPAVTNATKNTGTSDAALAADTGPEDKR